MPMAVWSTITWIRNPSESGKEVEIQQLTKKHVFLLVSSTTVITILFFKILAVLETPNIVCSTISITTSFLAASLTMIRCKWHCTDCALDYGNHKRSILFFRNDHIYDIFLFWSIWFHQLEKKRNSDVENVNEREQAIFFWQAIISRRNKIACSLFVNIPFSRKRMIKTVLQIFLW